jgi:hypothetical protein
VRPADLKAWREREGYTYKQVVELINAALPDRAYSVKSARNLISRWEQGERQMPADVERLLDTIALDQALGEPRVEPPLDDYVPPDDSPGMAGDTAPPPPGGTPAGGARPGGLVLPTEADPTLVRVCTELWEMIATGIGMVGAATGSTALRRDGEIIHGDKQALGKAYARLAEQNDTFRRMLTSMTSSGAWLEVAMVSGMTAGKMMRSHQEIRDQQRAERLAAEQEAMVDGNGWAPPEAAAAA